MRLGLFPGQQEFLRKAVVDAEKYRGARRRFLAVFGIGVAGAAGAGFVGGRSMAASSEPTKATEPSKDRAALLLDQMKRAATAPMPELERQFGTLLATLDANGDQPLLWLGFERLAQRVVIDDQPALRARLLVTARSLTVPDHLTALVKRLAALR